MNITKDNLDNILFDMVVYDWILGERGDSIGQLTFLSIINRRSIKHMNFVKKEVILMKDSPLNILAIKTILLSIFGLSVLPFLSVIVQYIDSIINFSSGRGYYANSNEYIFRSPLVYIGIVLCINIILGISYLVYNALKKKRGASNEKIN